MKEQLLLDSIRKELKKNANHERAKIQGRFFKTGKGQYGEGDIFIGVTVPETRKIAGKYKDIGLSIVKKLLESEIHEERLLGVIILVQKYQQTNSSSVAAFYKSHSKKINNWDLVDLSADKIIGHYYFDKPRDYIYFLAKSDNLWQRRTAIIATFYFIRHNQFEDTFRIAEILLHDKHDLIHKAVGWMLREAGKRDKKALRKFLEKYHEAMPRIMLRYAIENLPEKERQKYLKR